MGVGDGKSSSEEEEGEGEISDSSNSNRKLVSLPKPVKATLPGAKKMCGGARPRTISGKKKACKSARAKCLKMNLNFTGFCWSLNGRWAAKSCTFEV